MLPIRTKKELQEIRSNLAPNSKIGLVPTMGALHSGHASLIKKAVTENKTVIVTIFVNPTQFDNEEDLQKYPTALHDDLRLIADVSPNIMVFVPTTSEIYQTNVTSKKYDFHGLDKVMEGEFRENHFNGVGTIIETLFSLIKPDVAYFGEKDFQQLRIIQKMTEILKLPVKIIGCPIVRESNGLAMSSRNERLDPSLRQKAGFIYDTLVAAKQKFGTESVHNTKEWVDNEFENHPDFKMEYFEIADVETLTPAKRKIENIKYRGFIAVYANNIRLIDNIALN